MGERYTFGGFYGQDFEKAKRFFKTFAEKTANPYMAYDFFLLLLQNDALKDYTREYASMVSNYVNKRYYSKYHTKSAGYYLFLVIRCYQYILDDYSTGSSAVYSMATEILNECNLNEIRKMAYTILAELAIKDSTYVEHLGEYVEKALDLQSYRLAYLLCKYYTNVAKALGYDPNMMFGTLIQNEYPEALFDLALVKEKSDLQSAIALLKKANNIGHFNASKELVRLGEYSK